ncbi:hypothetical protein Y032_0030g2228 [Ancylostoma ceylanicum]|uniref:PB1 domain-containing protein n=1 Tax=Ancylostoma ceylanicum TaxID=53326 RepID=A0A016UT93_9BILA|nr:hypothetical protein Y032_0030g2228 [Ancylostoma ceylanicum]
MSEEESLATIKLYPYYYTEPRLTITFKDKEELYRKFQKKIQELDIPADRIYRVDRDRDRCWIDNPIALLEAVESENYKLSFFISTSEVCNHSRHVQEKPKLRKSSSSSNFQM